MKNKWIWKLDKPSEAFSDWKSELIDTMPKTNYTIDESTKSILLTLKIKNTGSVEWPSGFYVGLVKTNNSGLEERENDDALIKYSPEINKSIKANAVLETVVQLFSPGFAGTFTYTLSLFTLSKKPFGNEFEFTFNVKSVRYPR